MILITGGFGQLGKLLKIELLHKGYKPSDIILTSRKEEICTYNCIVETGDLQNIDFLRLVLTKYPVSKVFNFGTSSFVDRSLVLEDYLNFTRCKIFDNLIQIISEKNNDIWVCHPLSSEIFGIPSTDYQGLETKISPINSYGLQKSIEIVKCRFLLEQGFNIFFPVLFNIESIYRKEKFFTRRIIEGLIHYEHCHDLTITFYNAYSTRDFSYGPDIIKLFVYAMNKALTGDECFGSNSSLTVINFIEGVLNELKIKYELAHEEGLIKIIDTNGNIIAQEKDRSKLDEGRKFKFNGIFRHSEYQNFQIRGGKELIKKLTKDYVQYKNIRRTF